MKQRRRFVIGTKVRAQASIYYKWIFISPVKQTRSNPNTIRRLARRFPLLGILQFIMFKIHIFNTCRVPRTRQKPQGNRNYKFVARNNCCLQKFQLHSARSKLVDMLNGGKNLQTVTRLRKHSLKRHWFLQNSRFSVLQQFKECASWLSYEVFLN